jgi:glycogen phosphorylase
MLRTALVRQIAYFSMEVALEEGMPTYAGGLGILAGDTLRSAADLGLPMIGVTMLWRKGHFFQSLNESGWQHESAVEWSPHDWLVLTDARAEVEIEGRKVAVRAWQYTITGIAGSVVPVLLLDSDLPENDPFDRTLTDHLYGGDSHYRLCQEAVLGIGGVRMLRAFGYGDVASFHLNEGHAALLALELLRENLHSNNKREESIAAVKQRCVFTTHTPVPAGHDQFPEDLALKVLGQDRVETLRTLGCCEGALNMTLVALNLSRYVNGVTERHGEISRSMFPGYPIDSISNGVHSASWTAPAFQRLYDHHIRKWRSDFLALRYAVSIGCAEILAAHNEAKRELIEEANRLTNGGLEYHEFTIGFARRATSYKRPMLILRDRERLRQIASKFGVLQLIFSGKAHPQDEDGKALIREIVGASAQMPAGVKLVYLHNYDLRTARLMIAGVDLWLNTPKPPMEASGTSGMKAAHNGVPSLSIYDGWWLEGCVEGVTGWGIGPPDRSAQRSDDDDARDVYATLEERILPIYHHEKRRWAEIMRSTIALNASFYNTHRMLQEYYIQAYREQHRIEQEAGAA